MPPPSGLDDTHVPQRPRRKATDPELTKDRFDVGEVIDGRYRVLASLAAGGMGEVFKVEHISLGKQFALKVMLSGLKANADLVERFKLEAMAASRIGHPNIVSVSDLGQTPDGVLYFVMELLEGRTLTELLEREGAQSPKRTIEIGRQIAEALAAAHRHQIVHRDLKPDNVMLIERAGADEALKVLDFGIARVERKTGSATSVGQVLGTPAYMSPEQARGLAVDARSDIYSLGLILHELLTGAPTFTGDSAHMVMLRQVQGRPPRLPSSVPPPLAALVDAMLRKEPGERPQSMAAVIEALGVAAVAASESPSSRGAKLGLGVFAGLVVVTIAGVLLFTNEEEPPTIAPPPTPIALPRPPPPPTPKLEPVPLPVEAVAAPILSPRELKALVQQAQAAMKARDYRLALDKAEACLAADRSMVDCVLLSGGAASFIGDRELARSRYLEFMVVAPQNHPNRKMVADILANYFADQARK